MKRYPFKFLDSYDREDRGIFFGREEEINTLYEMVFQSTVILVYGASGTGKTSLINCGLAGKFQPHDWLDLMIRRGSDINASLEKALNDAGGNSTSQIDTNWHDEWSDEPAIDVTTLSPVARSIKAVYQKSFRPVYLIFDQFEELFILGTAAEQKLFIKTVQDILLSEQPVKLIFCIREEFLGYLFEFEKAVPQLLRKKLRIEPMNLEKVKQVIVGATEYEGSIIRLKAGESTQIAEGIFEKIKGKGQSLTIQLPFLQVFLDKFYLKISGDESREAEVEFSMQQLNGMGEIGDVLVNFLEEQVTRISKELKIKYPSLSPETTWKILSPFSTLEGTKQPINKKELYGRLPDFNVTMIDEVVDAFTKSRILRYNEAMDMFEIAHDALARPIAEKRSAEETALLEIKRLIKSQVSVKAEAREYFSERQLSFIDPYLKKFSISTDEQQWITKSEAFIQTQKDLEKKKQQEELIKTRKWLRVMYSLLVVAVISIIVAGFSYRKANKERIEAKKQRDVADSLKTLAQGQKDTTQNALNNIKEIQKKGVGNKYQGGIIFWSNPITGHGLIAAENDFEGLYIWGEAQQKCADYSVKMDGVMYNDWFLPPRDTLAILYFSKTIVGGFADEGYWSSTTEKGENAWNRGFAKGYQYAVKKNSAFRVRAVRAF